MLENEANDAERLEPSFPGGYDAQWNDDFHNVLHVLLTGEHEAYYANYREQPAQKLARVLAEGFAYQGEAMPTHGDKPRGKLSGHLPPTSFVSFLQNHDQVGNRALGERLHQLASAEALRAAAESRVEVEITTAAEVAQAQQQALLDALRKRLSRELVVSWKTDPSLVAGAVIRAGDLVIDGSVSGELAQLRQAVVAG